MAWFMHGAIEKIEFLNLQISEEPVYALGVHFAYERDAVLQRGSNRM